MLHANTQVNESPQQCEVRAAQDAAALLQRLRAAKRPKPIAHWLWEGMSPAGKVKFVQSFIVPGELNG